MLVTLFCRVYGVLLYAYPRAFRLEYGDEMQRLFRDRCRDAVRASDLARFILRSAQDWLRSTLAEQASHLPSAIARHVRAVWTAGRTHVPRGPIVEWGAALLIYLFVSTTLVQAYVIPTGSMEGNFKIGDHVLVDRLTFSDPGPVGRAVLPYRDVERGDVLVFLYPEDRSQTYVKRVIGLPGDRIHLENKQVVRNGRRLVEPYVQHTTDRIDDYRDNFPSIPNLTLTPRGQDMLAHAVNGEVVVPPDAFFVLGDNRDNSLDSRYWGFVPRANVVGKPLFVYWSFDSEGSDYGWSVRHLADVATHFFTRTRWERTLLVPRRQQAQETAP